LETLVHRDGGDIFIESDILVKKRGDVLCERIKVFGGWIVSFDSEICGGEGRIFVSDPKHEWEIEEIGEDPKKVEEKRLLTQIDILLRNFDCPSSSDDFLFNVFKKWSQFKDWNLLEAKKMSAKQFEIDSLMTDLEIDNLDQLKNLAIFGSQMMRNGISSRVIDQPTQKSLSQSNDLK